MRLPIPVVGGSPQLVQSQHFGRVVLAVGIHTGRVVLVDVVAEVNDDVELLVGKIGVRRL